MKKKRAHGIVATLHRSNIMFRPSFLFNKKMSTLIDNPNNIAIQPDKAEKTPKQTLADREGISLKKQGKKPGSRSKRAGRSWLPLICAALALIIVFVAYCFAGFWGVPWYLRENLPKVFAHDQRLHLDTPEISFNPFTFTLLLDNARIDDDGQKMVEIGAIKARLEALPLFRRQFVCRSLSIDHPRIQAVFGEDNRYNLRRLFASAAAPGNGNDLLNLAELPLQFSLNNIEIFDGQISLTDKKRNNQHVLENVKIAIPHIANIATVVKATVEPRFSAIFNGSPIELNGKPGRDNTGKITKLACTIRNLEIKRYLSYMPMKFPLAVTKGIAEGDLELAFAPAGGDVAIDFQLKLIDLELADNDKSLIVTAPTSHLDGVLRPMNGEAAFRNIVTHGFTVTTRNGFPWRLTQVLLTPSSGQENGVFSRLLVDNLLADNGSLQRSDDRKSVNEWDTIDVRISKYLRADVQKKDALTGSYSLTARHAATGGYLRFAGDLVGGAIASGDLSLEAMPLATLWPWLGKPELSGDGMANVQATLHFPDGQTGAAAKPWSLTNGRIETKKLSLGAWFKAESMKLDGFSLSEGKFSLGKVTLVGGETVFDAAKPPEIFTTGFPEIESLDYEGTLTLKDSQRKLPELHFSAIKIQATDLHQAQGPTDKDNVQIQAKLSDKGTVSGRGNVSILPLKLTLRSDFSNLPTARILPWYTNNAFLLALDFPCSGKGNILLPGAAFRGEISLAAGALTDKKTPYLSWGGLDLYGIRFDRRKRSASIGEMAFKKPSLTVSIDAASPPPSARLANFITRICGDSGKKDEAAVLEIQKISLQDGLVIYNDNRPRPPSSGNISAINGSFGAFATDKPAQATSLQLTASFAGSPINLTGAIAFLNGGAGSWRLTATGLPIKQFASQAGDFFGIGQEDGLINLDLSAIPDNQNIREDAVFTGKNLAVGSTKAETALLLALLTGKDGITTWRASASRPVDKTLAPISERGLTALRELMKKAQTAPFTVAGADDLEQNGALDFTPGQVKMSDQGRETLGKIRDFLAVHPLLALEVIGCADSIKDGEALKRELEAEEKNRVAKENIRRAAAWQHELNKKKGAAPTVDNDETDIPPPLPTDFAPAKPRAIEIDAAMLKDLANRRAELARNILINELAITPQRVMLGVPKIEKSKDNPQHRVVFGLRPLTSLPPPTAEAKETLI